MTRQRWRSFEYSYHVNLSIEDIHNQRLLLPTCVELVMSYCCQNSSLCACRANAQPLYYTVSIHVSGVISGYLACTHAHTHTRSHAHMHAHAHVYNTHTHTHPHTTHTHAHAHADAHAHAHAHAHTHTHTHTHTHEIHLFNLQVRFLNRLAK